LDLRLLRNTNFLVVAGAGTLAMTGFLPRYFLIAPSVVAKGVDASLAAWLLGLMKGLSVLGRVAAGLFADGYGRLTALICSLSSVDLDI
jgi:hypothetical protein